MDKRSWITTIVVAILGFFGIGVGVKKHQKLRQMQRDEEERERRKRDRLQEDLQRNQVMLQENQREILRMLKKQQIEIDPNEVTVEIDD